MERQLPRVTKHTANETALFNSANTAVKNVDTALETKHAYKEQDYYMLLSDFPPIDDLSIETFQDIKQWFHTLLHRINLNFYYNRRSKYEYTNILRLVLVKLRDVMVYYDECVMIEDIEAQTILNRVKRYNEAMKNYVQKMLDIYPTRFPPNTNQSARNFSKYRNQMKLELLIESLSSISLTNEQDTILRKRVLPVIFTLKNKKTRYSVIYYVLNSFIQILSLSCPSLVTITNFRDCEEDHEVLKYLTISLTICLSIFTNIMIFYKLNMRFSIYTRYYNKILQEIWKYISLSEKYYVTERITSVYDENGVNKFRHVDNSTHENYTNGDIQKFLSRGDSTLTRYGKSRHSGNLSAEVVQQAESMLTSKLSSLSELYVPEEETDEFSRDSPERLKSFDSKEGRGGSTEGVKSFEPRGGRRGSTDGIKLFDALVGCGNLNEKKRPYVNIDDPLRVSCPSEPTIGECVQDLRDLKINVQDFVRERDKVPRLKKKSSFEQEKKKSPSSVSSNREDVSLPSIDEPGKTTTQIVQILENHKLFHIFIETIEKYICELNDIEYEFTLTSREETTNKGTITNDDYYNIRTLG